MHLVYMAATHTRLEHSVGVVHQVQSLVESLNTRGLVASGPGPVIKDSLRETLRLAALCHDIGHGAMSHVSEYALDGNAECKHIISAFSEHAGISHESQLSEMAAYFLLGSPAFREFLAGIRAQLSMPPDAEQASRMQKLVIKQRIDDEVPLAHEMISGPFDADKLDYLARDARMCGVPIVSDITRLIQKVRATRAMSADLPEPLQTRLPENRLGYIITGLARSGGSTLMELTLARVLMFDKVYRHHKVRAAESMVFEIIQQLAVLTSGRPGLLPLQLSDEQLLDLTEESVCRFVNRSADEMEEDERDRVQTIADLAARLRARQLFVRGFAIAGTMTNDVFKDDEQHSEGLQLFLQALPKPRSRARIKSAIVGRLRQIIETLGLAEQFAHFEPALEAYVQLSPPKPAPKTLGTDTDHALLVDEDGTLTSFNDDAPEITGWSDAFIATQDLGHVFCPAEIAPYVFLAAEAEVRATHGIHLPRSMLPYAKQQETELDDIRRALVGAGFYADLPADLRPDPKAFSHAGFSERLDNAVSKLDGYAGPVSGDNQVRLQKREQTRARLRNYLKQFDDENEQLIELALKMLTATQQISRDDINSALNAFLAASPEFEGANLCTLGSMKDSSAIFANLALDAGAVHGMTTRDLSVALADSRPIVFIDDFIGRGSQTKDIIQAWLGLERTEELHEEREELQEAEQQALRAHKLGFVYVAGLNEGKPALEQFLAEEELDGAIHVHIPEESLPTLYSVLGSDPDFEPFRNFLHDAGMRALENHHGEARTEEWRSEKALGYGQKALLFTSMFNTPTVSVAALWAGGDSSSWQPIFPRRSKN
ncbi:phosphoribosyltransferase-like protein [Nocardioides dilutus]